MIKYFIKRNTEEKIVGEIIKDEKNIFINNKKIGAIDYIIIECDKCHKEEKAVFKRRDKYFCDEILCTSCHKKKTNLERYGVEYTLQSKIVKQKAEQTNLERYGSKTPYQFGSNEFNNLIREKYGVENVNKLSYIRDKIDNTNFLRYGGTAMASSEISNKIRKTKLEKYGNEYYTNREKNKLTIKEKYGVENISQLQKTQNTIKQNNLKKYGVENTTQLPEIQEKMKNTMIENWGVNNPNKHPDIIKKRIATFKKRYGVSSIAQLEKSKKTMIERYGVEVKNSCEWFEINEQKIQGKFELFVAQFLFDNNVKFITHNNIQQIKYFNKDNNECLYHPDFYLPDYNLYLEPHAEYYWDDDFVWKMKEVEKQVNILYFNEDYELNNLLEILNCL